MKKNINRNNKGFLKGKGVGYFLLLPAIVCVVMAYVLYTENGITLFNPELNTDALLYLEIAIIFCVLSLIFNWKVTTYAAYLACLYAFIWFISSQVTYITNVFVAIDGTTFTTGFILTAAFYVIACVLMLLAGIFAKWAPWKRNS